MATHSEHARRYAEQAGTDSPRFYARGTSNVFALRDRGHDTIFSYGFHFPMAKLMADGDNPRGWWLVNADRYSVTTTQHQNQVRSALKATGLPMLLVPFTAINEAGIREDTIKPVEILPDRYTWEPRTREEAPHDYELDDRWHRNWSQRDDGRWSYEASVHHLGEALFTAEYRIRGPFNEERFAYDDMIVSNAYFLSAFDDNEPGFGLYFLAELPQGVSPATVDEAREALKPNLVKGAEAQGLPVLRQGDVFAIPWAHLRTKDLPGPSKRSEYVLGVNHLASEVRLDKSGNTYARGFLRHKPREMWRRPEHRRVTLGDRKTWYELVKNRVPDGRSWSISGNVD